MTTKRTPDYELVLWDSANGGGLKAGVAWTNEDGRINIKLNPGVTITYADTVAGLRIRLKPWTGKAADRSGIAPSPPPDADDDIPF